MESMLERLLTFYKFKRKIYEMHVHRNQHCHSEKLCLYCILQIHKQHTLPCTHDLVLLLLPSFCGLSQAPESLGLACWWLPGHLASTPPHLHSPNSSKKTAPTPHIFINLNFIVMSTFFSLTAAKERHHSAYGQVIFNHLQVWGATSLPTSTWDVN